MEEFDFLANVSKKLQEFQQNLLQFENRVN